MGGVNLKIAVVGATGLVGREVVKILLDNNVVEKDDLTLYASKSSAGMLVLFEKHEFEILELNKRTIKKFDYVFFCAGKNVALEYAQTFINKGAVVIDNSSAFRRSKNVPLIVPEINLQLAVGAKLIANPNCSTIGVSLPLYYLSKQHSIKRVVVSTYQAVSGAGQKGIEDLQNGTNKKFAYQIANNLIPQIDSLLANGYTFEEDKMSFELKKILQNRFLKVCATCVRVPILNCHSESINIEFENEPNIRDLRKILSGAQGVCMCDNLKNNIYPMPSEANGKDEVFVGRIRKDISNKRAINMFICFDNIRKGAALNAVQIVQGLERLKGKK
ncbi:MAG: aspartate-semialdehyde dehydrogenase [Clostridia bacterium]|nr:aspartate-semialdehyde dehydrogenase [Clostridia bacterium]